MTFSNKIILENKVSETQFFVGTLFTTIKFIIIYMFFLWVFIPWLASFLIYSNNKNLLNYNIIDYKYIYLIVKLKSYKK